MNTREIISFILGLCSSLAWFVAEIPQIIRNFKTKSVNGIAKSLFILLSVGDISNLVSVILTKGTISQYLVSCVFVLIDSILMIQILIYSCKHEKNDEYSVENINETPKVLPLAALAQMVNSIDPECIYKEDLTGMVFAWVAVVIYFSSRIEQLVKNFKNKSVKDLSIWFSLGVIGNILYVVSLLVISVNAQYLYDKLPWLLNAILPLCCDIIIFVQRFYFKHKNDSSSAESN